MNRTHALIDALTLCIPGLDQAGMLHWMADHRERQELLEYVEWKEYFGEVPQLRPLAGDMLADYDDMFILDLLGDVDESGLDPELAFTLPYELPYLEHINAYLKPHGLRLVDLLFENAYIMCVRDDSAALARLSHCLQAFGMDICLRDPLDQAHARAYVEALVGG